MLIVKAGGRVIKNNFDKLVESVRRYQGKVVFVHGGGDQVTETSKKLGIEPKFVVSPEGIRSRYTTKEELEVFIMVMSSISRHIVERLSTTRRALAISGADGPSVIAERKKRIMIIDERGKKRIIEGGYTGKITSVNGDLLRQLLNAFDVLVVAPLAYDPTEPSLLNVDGDQMAFALARELKPETLLLLTDVDGVLVDQKVVERLTAEQAKELSMKIGPGMNRKLLMAAEAVSSGVKRVVIGNGLVEDPIANALGGKGTVIE
ncbi:MAG: [LysW]-aminoadipate/[LysW]-glutamate kinase [Thermoprotei archaeon]